MKLLDALRREHETIESVASALVAFASRERAEPADAERLLRFFRVYAGRFHHGREEEVLFRALVRETGVAEDSGPLRSLVERGRVGGHDRAGRPLTARIHWRCARVGLGCAP